MAYTRNFYKQVPCVGATLAVVVANSEVAANAAAAQVRVFYEDVGVTPVVSITQAIEKKSFYSFPIPGKIPTLSLIVAGNADKALKSSYGTASGRAAAGGQYHFYMEAQVSNCFISWNGNHFSTPLTVGSGTNRGWRRDHCDLWNPMACEYSVADRVNSWCLPKQGC
jgi:xanthine dehydrogenase molybdopterin-binding subunit B